MSEGNGQSAPRAWGLCRASSIKQIESCETQRSMIAETCRRLELPEPTILKEPALIVTLPTADIASMTKARIRLRL
jgi:mannose-1-phosphate guanylyltransferase